MESERTTAVCIDFTVDAEPISGRVRQGAGSSRPFHGWLELASAIEDALAAARRADVGDTRARRGRPMP